MTSKFETFTQQLFSDEKFVLTNTLVTKDDTLVGVLSDFQYIKPEQFPFDVCEEHRQLLYLFAVGNLRRCGIDIDVDCNVKLIETEVVESLLTGKKIQEKNMKIRAFKIVRIAIFLLFIVGAYRLAITVANFCLDLHALPKNYDRDGSRLFNEEKRLRDLLRVLISKAYNDSESRFFDENPPFSEIEVVDSTHTRCCQHGISLQTEVISGCIFTGSADPAHAARLCKGYVEL